MTAIVLDLLSALCLLIGSVFALVAAIGLVKFSNFYTRLHGPTKNATLGIGSLLLASMLQSFARGEPAVHELLILLFLFLTAPISAHLLIKSEMHERPADRPQPPKDCAPPALD